MLSSNFSSDPVLDSQKRRAKKYWAINQSLILLLLGLWGLVTFGMGIWWVEPLNQYKIFGFKLGYWIANQGSVYVFCFIVCFYAWCMNKIDDAMSVHE